MKPAPFDYLSPATLDEALVVMDEHGYSAKLLAGGQSLIPTMNFRLAQPSLLVDLNGVGELNKLHPDESHGVRLGAMVRHSQVEHSQVVRDEQIGESTAVAEIGEQIQHLGLNRHV